MASFVVSPPFYCPPQVDLNAKFLVPKVNVSYYMVHEDSLDSAQTFLSYLLSNFLDTHRSIEIKHSSVAHL